MPTSIDTLKEKGRRLRILSLKATTEAGSGHPSSCFSAADLTSVIFFHEMHFDPRDPENARRLEEAERFRRDNPNGLIIRHRIVHPPNGELNWENVSREERERYLAAYGRDDA